MPPLGKKKYKPASYFAGQRGSRGALGAPGRMPTVGGLIKTGGLDWEPVKNLYPKLGAFAGGGGGGYAPRGGGIQRPGGGTKVPRAPGGQWWASDYTGGDPNFTLQGAVNSGLLGPQSALDLTNLGIVPRALDIAGTGGSFGAGDIESDWEMQAALADINAANAADAIGAQSAIEALATQWGGDLSGLVGKGLISQKAAEAAKANQFSTMSELGRQLSTGTAQGVNQLAARGILQSGAMPALSEELNRQYQRETTTGLQDVMAQITGIKNRQASAAAERRGGLQGVRASIANRLAALPQYQQTPAMKAFWDPQVGAYVDDWGRRYDAGGQRVG